MVNYRQHHNTVIHFVPGINTIVGANNAGKSTIPEAIEFALFGAKALRDTGGSWITDGCSRGSATVLFDIGEDLYQVGRDATAAKVLKNKELAADYKANATRYVGQVTGVNHAGFRLGHYVRQKELAAFSQLRPGKRQETIEKMLKIHAVDRVLATLKGETDTLDIRLKTLLSTAQDVDQLADELITIEIERAALVPIDTVPQETIVETTRNLLSEAREKLATCKAQEEELNRLKKDLETFDDIKNQFDAADDALCLFEPEHVGSLEDLQTKFKELQKQEVLKAKMSTIKEELDKVLVVVEQPIKPDSAENDACVAAISAAESNLKTVAKLKGLNKCPTCLTEIADVDKLIQSLTDTLETARTNGNPAMSAYRQATSEYNRNESLYRDYQVELRRRNTLTTQFIEVEFSEEEKMQVENEIALVTANNKKQVELQHAVDMLKAKVDTLTKADERLKELELIFYQATLEETQSSVNNYTAILERENEVLKELKIKALEVVTRTAKLDGRIQELQKQVESARTLRITISDTADKVAQLKYRFDVYQKFKKYLTAKIRPMIGTVAETLFHRVTKNRYSSYQLSNDYEVIINTHQGFVRKLSTISGSENDLANLCLRLAIATLRSNRLVGNLGFIILDEISSSFDEDRTKQTLEGLLELKDIIPQIINITHKHVEMKFADKLITVVETNNRSSIV